MFRFKHILILVFFILFATFLTHSSHFVLQDIGVGSVSDKDILAPKTISYVNKEKTEQLKQEAAASVQNVYVPNEKVAESVVGDLTRFIDSIVLFKNNVSQKEVEITLDLESKDKKKSVSTFETFDYESFYKEEKKKVYNPYDFTEEELEVLLSLDRLKLEQIKDILTKELSEIFFTGILLEDVERTRNKFSGNPNFTYFFPKEVRTLLIPALSEEIIPNLVYDEEKTAQKRKEVLDAIEDVQENVLKNQVLVRYGDVVTKEQVKMLEALGLIKGDIDYKSISRDVPLIAFLLLMLYLYCYRFFPSLFANLKLFSFLFFLGTFPLVFSTFWNENWFLVIPFMASLLIIVSLWGRRMVIFSGVIFSFLVNIQAGNDYSFLFLLLFASIMMPLFYQPKGKRVSLFYTGVLVGGMISILHVIACISIDPTLEFSVVIKQTSLLLLASVIGSIGAVGILPFIESFFGLLTYGRLHELYDLTHPLLKRLNEQAQGTFEHSNRVGTLAELAAEKIGANGLLLRVGAYFHDVGKLRNPEYFIENSTPEENPHQNLSPVESAKIILQHPHDSVALCREYHVPEPIIQLIQCHHSDSTLHHFYQRAKEEDPTVDISLFQYQTPTPKTKEEGILLLADSAEAYSRVLPKKSTEEVRSRLKEMILEKVRNGDLRDCALTFQDYETIVDVFTNHFLKSNHERISYK